jgi:hypothetical protein
MGCPPLLLSEDLETFASFAVAAIVTPGRLAAAAMQALPARILRRDMPTLVAVGLLMELSSQSDQYCALISKV